jgi:hypothetical protein
LARKGLLTPPASDCLARDSSAFDLSQLSIISDHFSTVEK